MQMLAELTEFASFKSAEQRYIRRSLDVALAGPDATDQWARGILEAAAIGLQAKAYEAIEEIAALVPEDVEPDDPGSLLAPLIRISAFDLHQGKLTSFAAYRFLYERLFGAGVRPWLMSAFCAAAAMPCVHPELRAELLQSLDARDMTASGWRTRAAVFFPEWVEKVPSAVL
ncbi:MAG TPA: hypothetical protein VGU01_13600 [Sphingomicrobium sp.]|nr:hypothetical protein [Sphingomicrobium sp.]